MNYFGKGLVKTPVDFGSQGALPSHPRLLDWLSWQFINSGWDLKALHKQIVMSKTYRQSSWASNELRQQDPENIWLARGPAQRLTAEMMRDMALAASGLLVNKIGGPSVKPYQPEGLWSFGSNKNYEQDTGENLYRRSLYTFWKRTVPPPAMNIFDAPSRSTCIIERPNTNTPLQALALMNDVQFVEACRALAYRSIQSETDLNERIAMIHRVLTARSPDEKELQILTRLYIDQKTRFQQSPDTMQGFLDSGEWQPDSDHESQPDKPALGALTVLASAVMNSDACMVKR